MKKNHFLLPYAGNKRNECEGLYNEVKDKLSNIKTIVEPFCGTSSFSFYVSLKHPMKYEYILNDNNKYLMELYKIAKVEGKLKKLVDNLNKELKDINKEKYNEIIKKDDLVGYIIKNKIYAIRAGLFPSGDKAILKSFDYMLDCPIINFLRTETIKFNNIDAIEIMDKYKNNNKCLIFLDPPYLLACNDFYADPKANIYQYLYDNKINNMNACLLVCLESNWIIKLLFDGLIKKEYGKKYELSKKHTTHLIITNF